ncbi:hypothetical protein D1007_20148 [Hordeum vulgare]|nr:hypothetical protein D1007_20148 [Hordeum vulgare]
MAETTGDIKSLLVSLIQQVDTGQRTAEAQIAFNEQVSSDLAHLRKQVDLTQTDVDEVRHHRDQPKSTSQPSPRHQPPASAVVPPPEQPFARLANVGPPLIGTRPAASLFGAAQLRAQQDAYQEETWDTYTFCTAVKEEFGPDEFEMEMHKLLQLRQTGTVAAYREEFVGHMYHLLALDASLSPKFFVSVLAQTSG